MYLCIPQLFINGYMYSAAFLFCMDLVVPPAPQKTVVSPNPNTAECDLFQEIWP